MATWSELGSERWKERVSLERAALSSSLRMPASQIDIFKESMQMPPAPARSTTFMSNHSEIHQNPVPQRWDKPKPIISSSFALHNSQSDESFQRVSRGNVFNKDMLAAGMRLPVARDPSWQDEVLAKSKWQDEVRSSFPRASGFSASQRRTLFPTDLQ